ncbi:cupredoxin domain-containing protein [Nitrospira sp. NS4]|uniref:cupredoxin domain-containing protein n=1 Tax=Nitrospira sp. NS4 TaxID=3414498 RepID=UPI003C2F5BEE
MRRPCPFTTGLFGASLLSCSGLLVTGGAAAAAPADPVEITFESTSPYYLPRVAIVPAGTSIRWVNTTGSPHSVRHDGCLTDDACAFQSIAVPPDSSFFIAPLPPGRYAYHCELHPVMTGTLVVVDPSARHDGIRSGMEDERAERTTGTLRAGQGSPGTGAEGAAHGTTAAHH